MPPQPPLGDADNSYDHTGDCVHFLATANGQAAGTVRLVPSKGKLTRLAVLAPLRSTGAGRELVHAMEEWLVREVRAGRMQHLVTEGRAGRAVHVKIHSQVGCGAPRTPRTGQGIPRTLGTHARSPLSSSTPNSGIARRGRALTRRASRTSSWCVTLRSRCTCACGRSDLIALNLCTS